MNFEETIQQITICLSSTHRAKPFMMSELYFSLDHIKGPPLKIVKLQQFNFDFRKVLAPLCPTSICSLHERLFCEKVPSYIWTSYQISRG